MGSSNFGELSKVGEIINSLVSPDSLGISPDLCDTSIHVLTADEGGLVRSKQDSKRRTPLLLINTLLSRSDETGSLRPWEIAWETYVPLVHRNFEVCNLSRVLLLLPSVTILDSRCILEVHWRQVK